LFDPHASVREEARYHLRKLGEANFAPIYRYALTNAEEGELYSAVNGLGETGTASDDRVVLPYALHGSAKVRRAAVKAIARLNGDKHLPVFINALGDATPAVSREARKALTGRAVAVGGRLLWEMFGASSLPHVRRNIFYLLSRLGKWDAIYYLIRATGDPDVGITEASRLGVVRWLSQYNRSFSAPTPEQISRLDGALRERGQLLDEGVREQLWFSVKGF
jgi:HEAT repeat protein